MLNFILYKKLQNTQLFYWKLFKDVKLCNYYNSQRTGVYTYTLTPLSTAADRELRVLLWLHLFSLLAYLSLTVYTYMLRIIYTLLARLGFHAAFSLFLSRLLAHRSRIYIITHLRL